MNMIPSEKLDTLLTNAKTIKISNTIKTSDFGFSEDNYYVSGDSMTYRYVFNQLTKQGFPFEGNVTNICKCDTNNSFYENSDMFAKTQMIETYCVCV